MHLTPIYLIQLHIVGYAGFFIMTSFFAGYNHTRFAAEFPFLWKVEDHDIHHRVPQSNYGQYVMFWDYMFSTFQGYYERPTPIPDYGPVRDVDSKSPNKVVIVGSGGLVGTRLIEICKERG
eukprot:UN23012